MIPLPWYLHLESSGSNAVFGRGLPIASFENYWPVEFYFSSGLPDVIAAPTRDDLPPRFFPLLYADTWGDYFGIWSWGPPRPESESDVKRRLTVQSVVGLPLTALAVAGWLALLALGIARWRAAPERLLVGLAPLAGLAAVLYYATRGSNSDGDSIKAMFMLPAVPFWALSFGFCVDVLCAGAAGWRCPCSPCSPSAGSSPCPMRPSPSSRERLAIRPRRPGRGRAARHRRAGRVGNPDRDLRGPGFEKTLRCLVNEKGAAVTTPRDPIAGSAELGALATVVETNGVTVSVAASETSAERVAAAYRSVGGDLGERLEVRGRTVYLWERPPSPTQRQTVYDCAY